MRSARAAKDTATMIEESVINADNGVAINEEVLKNLEEIKAQVAKVNEVVMDIADASGQQSSGVEEISCALQEMNQLTQQNAANSEESASAAEELSAQANEMRSMVDNFNLTDSKRVCVSNSQEVEPQQFALHSTSLSDQGFGANPNASDPRKLSKF